ncbi:uncharacterized protein [Venturia canescens]|uniref:uncharacterized protein n=1 Tax=Venturia canescens TaxID=32260 RepID=UPI001C9C9EF4|nr:uncharacterized protein LOC122408444 [Venturia canescens]
MLKRNMIVEKIIKEKKVRVDVLVGDEDASTICHVQQAANHNVEKWIDINHTVKKFSNKLYAASKKHKFLKASVIKYLKRCFCYCIARNIGNSDGLKNGLRNIAKHTFGQHDTCGEWCKAQNDPGYVFQHLPEGRPFSSKAWNDDFEQILESYMEKAEKISPGGSSQRNESFNHMAVTRAPKSRFYGSTPALSYRVAAAVLQKNDGADHMTEVNRRAGLSPGKVTQKYRHMMQSKREIKARRQQTIQFKRRRLFLKNKSGPQQRKEGLTYMSGMGPTMEKAITATCAINEFIPELAPLQLSSIFVHIAAKCGAQSFEAYMIPQQPIHPKASEITGFSVDNGYLLYFRQRVESTSSATAAKDFVDFLCNLNSQILIVGHNVIKFDAPLIFRWLAKHDLVEKMCSITYGLTDTIPLLRQGKISKQDVLAKQYLTSPEWNSFHEKAHNALIDCYLLNGLLEHFEINDEVLKSKALSLREFFEQQAMLRKQKTLLPFLLPLKNAVSRTMLNKMARHGVTMEELLREFQLHGNKGIEVSLGVRVNGKPRITTNKRIVENVIECVKNLV